MREELARLVNPVLNYGLVLKERLDRGEAPHLETEQAMLQGLLTESEGGQPDFGGDRTTAGPVLSGARTTDGASGPFLGARYALVCWLDELFVLYSPWADRWSEHKLEVALYATNDRAWRFWDQARQAGTRSSSDALEAYFLCVALGFRGELGEEPARLQEWFEATRTQLTRILAREWTGPPELEPPIRVPPLRGRDRLRRLVLTACAALLVLVPAVAVFLVMMMTGKG